MPKRKVSGDLNYLQGAQVITVVRSVGDLNSAKTADGFTVKREEKLWCGPEYGFVYCASYDNHFLFNDPMMDKKTGRWSPCCTCGGMAGIVGANVYAKDASPTTIGQSTMAGTMIVCLAHAQSGKHVDGSS